MGLSTYPYIPGSNLLFVVAYLPKYVDWLHSIKCQAFSNPALIVTRHFCYASVDQDSK